MMKTPYSCVQEEPKKTTSLPLGMIGALLGAVLGSVVWTFYSVATQQVSTFLGFLIGLLVGLGYDLLKGPKGAAKMITMLLCVMLSVCASEFAFYGISINNWYQEEVELLTNGTDDEIAKYYYTDEDYAIYEASSTIYQKLYIQNLREEVEMTRDEYIEFIVYQPDFKEAFISDLGQSIMFALLGSFLLILAGGKGKKEAATIPAEAFSETVEQESSAENNTDASAE